MIDRIEGIIVQKNPTNVVLKVGGISFLVQIPLTTAEKLPQSGNTTELITYFHVREDAMELYGFNTVEQRNLFVNLIKVSGVGPKLAIAILSRFEPNELANVVADNNAKRLTTVSGIGKKTAERLLIELRDKLKVQRTETGTPVIGEASITTEAIQALEVLGFTTAKADEAVRHARKDLGDDAQLEEIVKRALKG